MRKQLVLLFDGTACSFSTNTNIEVLRKALAYDVTKLRERECVAAGTETDAYKLDEETSRLVIYQEGLGAPPLAKKIQNSTWPWPLSVLHETIGGYFNLLPEVISQLEAVGITDNIKHGYRFLAKHYSPGDQIFLFGFSRGAYTLRLLISIIRKIGLLDASKYASQHELQLDIEKLFTAYIANFVNTNNLKNKCHPSRGIIRFAGFFDCVPGPILEKIQKDARLGDVVQTFRHAVATNENRLEFTTELAIPDGCPDFDQQWFPGSHGDVGGSYPLAERGLANGALEWIVTAANKCGLQLNPKSIANYVPDPLAIAHDSRAESVVAEVKWSMITANSRRRLLLTTYENLHSSTIERYEQNPAYRPSNVNHALVHVQNTLLAFNLNNTKCLPNTGLLNLLPLVPPPDEWSDAESDDDMPAAPSLVPKSKKKLAQT